MGMESRREINFPILLVNTNKQARLRVDLKGYCGFVSYVLFVAFGEVLFVVEGGGVLACGAVGDSSSAVYVDAFMRFWASAVRTGGGLKVSS